MRPEVDVLLEFLSEWKTCKEVRAKFDMSNTEFFNFFKWLIRIEAVQKVRGTIIPGHTNKSYLYKKV